MNRLALTMGACVSVLIFSCQSPRSVEKTTHYSMNREVQSVLERPIFLPGATSERKRPGTTSSSNGGGAALMPSPPHAGAPPAQPIAPQISELFVQKMNSLETFESFATLTEGFIKGAAVKFFIDRRVAQAPQIYFINGNYKLQNGERPQYTQFHYYFAQEAIGLKMAPDDYNQHTYFTNDLQQKQFVAGTLQRYEMLKGGVKTAFMGIQFYPQDYISEATLLEVLKIVKSNITLTDLPFYFISYGSQQTYKTVQEGIEQLQMSPTTVDQVYAGIPYVPMNLGQTYGYLRFQPKGVQLDELSPSDIPIFDELPLDLSVISGVITTVVQDAGAHVNLKSKERNTPNMVLKDPKELDKLKKYDGKPIKLTVESEFFKIEPVTAAVVQKYFDQKNKNKKWVAIKNGPLKNTMPFDEMAVKFHPLEIAKMSTSYGGKASKLGYLASPMIVGVGSDLQKKMNYRMTPMGFAIPVSAYLDFVNSNAQLKKVISDLAKSEMGVKGYPAMSPKIRLQKVREIQNLFYQTPLPSSLAQDIALQISELKKTAQKFYPLSSLNKVKVRSSANAEDIPNFDGAGLHSSYSAKADQLGDANEVCKVEISQDGVATKEDMVPATVYCAVKGVFASLWNKRAIEERNFARIDQSSVAMGIAINNAYDFRKKSENVKEVANAVVVTRVINAKGVYGYRLSVNTDDNLVTNPTPGTQAEIVVASFVDPKEKPQLSFIQYAKTDAQVATLDHPMLDQKTYERLMDIAKEVELKYCQNTPSYYPNGACYWVMADPSKPSALDMEFKIYSNGEVLIKQVREFSGQ